METIFGTCDAEFSKVEKVFRKNFIDGWEYEGASVAIFHHGKMVVNLSGGYADKKSAIKWSNETRTVIFSATKAIAALAISMLVDQGHIKYNDKIRDYWPEFGQNGKENITLKMIMCHQAGLAHFKTPIRIEDAKNPEVMAKIIEIERPEWMPGTKTGYHAFTYGWLLDQIIRRVDPKKRSMTQFIHEEFNLKFDVDLYLGNLPVEQEASISRLSSPTKWYQLREIIHDPRVLIVHCILLLQTKNSLAKRLLTNPDWIPIKKNQLSFNNPKIRQIEQCACLGISKAKDLAKLFALMLDGKIVSEAMLEKFKNGPEILNEIDQVIKLPMSKGYGFMYERHPKKLGKFLYGHPGYGGTTVMISPDDQLVIAYVSNGLKSGMGELTRSYRLLRNAALECL